MDIPLHPHHHLRNDSLTPIQHAAQRNLNAKQFAAPQQPQDRELLNALNSS